MSSVRFSVSQRDLWPDLLISSLDYGQSVQVQNDRDWESVVIPVSDIDAFCEALRTVAQSAKGEAE